MFLPPHRLPEVGFNVILTQNWWNQPLARIEDVVKNIATTFTANFENEDIRSGFISTLLAL